MDNWQALADRHGLIRAGATRRAGMTARELRRLVTTDQIVHLHHGWYALSSSAVDGADTSWDRRRRLHIAQTRAAVAAHGGHAGASHHSALALYGLPTYSADLRQVHLTRCSDDLSRRRQGLTVHQQVTRATWSDGMIDVGVAVAQAGCGDGPMASLIAADAALHAGLVSVGDLHDASACVLGDRSFAVRRILALADGRAESPGESRLRRALLIMGFASTPQVTLSDAGFAARVDLLLEEAPVVVEFDGFVKYSRAAPYDLSLAPADIVAAEKYREDRIRELGYEVVRVTWTELVDLPALRCRLEAAVARSAGRGGGPELRARP